MPYIADHLWQDVLAAAGKLIDDLDPSGHLYPDIEALKNALEAAEDGSDAGGGSCATG